MTGGETRDCAGYALALRAAGLPVEPGLIVNGENGRNATAAVEESLLHADPRRTALFAVDNVLTLGAFKALQQSGLHFPGEVSLLGFNGPERTTVVGPTLSVIAQNPYDWGAVAVRRLVEPMRGDVAPPQVLPLGTRLVKRDSVGRSVSSRPRTCPCPNTPRSLRLEDRSIHD